MKTFDGLSSVASRLQKVWQSWVQAIVNSSELRVWQTVDRQGHCNWHAYDPMTGRRASFGSALEMRSWIEQLYYSR